MNSTTIRARVSMGRLFSLVCLAAGFSCALIPTNALAVVTTYGINADGNFNVYEVRGTHGNGGATTFYNAHLDAISRTNVTAGLPGIGAPVSGNLTSVYSTAQNTWLFNIAGRNETWIGLTDDTVLFGATEQGNSRANWKWINGDPYTDLGVWATNEPNEAPAEDAVQFNAGGGWNDHQSNIPGSGNGTGPSLRYLIEYKTNIPLNQLSAWKVTTYKARLSTTNTPQVQNLANVNDIIAGTGAFTGRTVTTNIATTSSVGGEDSHFAPNNPYPAGIGTEDFVIVGRGKLVVAATQTYTIGISGDDGGRFLIDLNNNNTFDGGLENVVIDDALHGHRDKFGEVTLNAGTYNFEWVGFERAGGDGWDAFYATGTQLTNATVTQDAFNANVTTANGWNLFGSGANGITVLQPDGINPGIQISGYQSVTTVTPGFNVGSRANADTMIATPAEQDRVVDSYHKVFNIRGTGNGLGGNGHFGTSESDQNNVPGYTDGQSDYAVVGTGFLQVTADKAGTWTIGAYADDGKRIRIDLNGDLDFDDLGEEVGNDGDGDLFTTVNLTAGAHKIEFMYFENEGDDSGEIFAAQGTFTSFGETSNWRLLGDTTDAFGLNVTQVANPVPEPSTLALAALGLLGLASQLRRRNSTLALAALGLLGLASQLRRRKK